MGLSLWDERGPAGGGPSDLAGYLRDRETRTASEYRARFERIAAAAADHMLRESSTRGPMGSPVVMLDLNDLAGLFRGLADATFGERP